MFDIRDALPVVLAIKLLFTTEFTQISPQCLCFGYFSRQRLNSYQHINIILRNIPSSPGQQERTVNFEYFELWPSEPLSVITWPHMCAGSPLSRALPMTSHSRGAALNKASIYPPPLPLPSHPLWWRCDGNKAFSLTVTLIRCVWNELGLVSCLQPADSATAQTDLSLVREDRVFQ